MNFKIHNLDGTLFDKDIKQATLPTVNGELTILENHLPLVTLTKPGEVITIDKSGNKESITLESPGLLEIEPENLGMTIILK